MSGVATRLLSLILMLQTRATWKAADLAAELSVSERTIHRYMGMLEEMGIPIYSERGPYGGFGLVRGYKLPPMIFTAEEATVLYMGAKLVKDVWGQTYADAVTAVSAKLDNVLPDDLRQAVAQAQRSLVVDGWTHRDYQPWQATLHTLRRCIGERRCARLVYRGRAQREGIERVVAPYALALQWGTWYLVGFCHLRAAMRTFRLEGVQQVTPIKEGFTVPREFSVREYLERTMRDNLPYEAVVHVSASVADGVREMHGHWMEIVDHADGSITAHFRVVDLDWAAGWVLGFGAAARAMEPPELIAKVQAAAEGALQRYQRLPDTNG